MNTKLTGRRLELATAVLSAILVAGCASSGPASTIDDPGEWVGGTPEAARAIVEDWLERASTGADDLGWGLLYPTTRTDLIGSDDAYRAALGAADWSTFEYEITGVRADDGEYRVEIDVREAPAVLEDWSLVQFHVVDGVGPVRSADGRVIESGDGFVTVRIGTEPEGAGIQGG